MQQLQERGGYPGWHPSCNSAIERLEMQKHLLASLMVIGAAFATLASGPGSSPPATAPTEPAPATNFTFSRNERSKPANEKLSPTAFSFWWARACSLASQWTWASKRPRQALFSPAL